MLEWLKKWWWAVVGGLLAVLGFGLGASLKKTPVIAKEDEEKKAAEEEAKKKAAEAAGQRDAEVRAAQDAHDTAAGELLESEKKLVKELESDPDATNEFLKQTGKDVRGS